MLVLTRHRGESVIIRKLGVEVAQVRVVQLADIRLRLRFSGAEGIEFVTVDKDGEDDKGREKTAAERDEIAVLENGVEVARVWVVEIGRKKARIGFGGDRATIKFIRSEIAGTSRDFQHAQ